MISRTITVADVACVTGFSRHKLKGLFRELPGYGAPATQARVAREYSPHDLIVLSVCCLLDERYGLKRAVIGQLVSGIQSALLGPRVVAQNAHLIVNIPTLSVRYVEKATALAEGLIFPMGDVFQRIDAHLQYGESEPLNLPPMAIPTLSKDRKPLKAASTASGREQRKSASGAER